MKTRGGYIILAMQTFLAVAVFVVSGLLFLRYLDGKEVSLGLVLGMLLFTAATMVVQVAGRIMAAYAQWLPSSRN